MPLGFSIVRSGVAYYTATGKQKYSGEWVGKMKVVKQGLTLSTVPSSGTSDIDCRASTSVQLLFRLTSGIIRRIVPLVRLGK